MVGFDEEGLWTGELEHSYKSHINQQHRAKQAANGIYIANARHKSKSNGIKVSPIDFRK